MSAIAGAISLTGKRIEKEKIDILRNAFHDCIIDREEVYEDERVFSYCGLQYVTDTSKFEELPYGGPQYFNADVVLDNRDELFEMLGLSLSEDKKAAFPDGKLLCEMIKFQGSNCLEHLLGAFAFVSYEPEKSRLLAAADATGTRLIYHCEKDGIFYYSSLIEPLKLILEKYTINERWMSDFIGQDGLMIFTECVETPILEIKRLAPAGVLEINDGKIKSWEYWDLDKIKAVRYSSNDEYKRAFRDLYKKCVESVMRSPKETGIFLSGGYDSSSVAVWAAKKLEGENRKLYSFTSVPYKKYKKQGVVKEGIEFLNDDETEVVKKTQEMYPNIETSFMDLPEMNPWFDRNEYLEVCEIPYKSIQNSLWTYSGMKLAYEKDVRIMLAGMNGNGTVSFDNTQVYFVWLFRHLHWKKLWSEIKAFNKKQHYTKKSVLKTTIRQAFGKDNMELKNGQAFIQNGFAKMTYLKEYGTDIRVVNKRNAEIKGMQKCQSLQRTYLDRIVMRHIGEFCFKDSLHSGVLLRDPTMDKRMIEFCLGIPYNQYTHDGEHRALIRDYMRDLMPKEVIEAKWRGLQSVDAKNRILEHKDLIKKEWIEGYKSYKNSRIDADKALEELNAREMEELSAVDMNRHIYTQLFLEYWTK